MLDAYTVRKAIPRVVLAVIAINLSIYLCIAALDITMIIGRGMHQLLVSPFLQDFDVNGVKIEANAENSILGILGVVGILGSLIVAVIASVGAVGAAVLGVLGLLLPLIITIALIILAVLFTLVIRQGLLIFLIIVSPVAFACYILPGTEKYFKQWLDLFTRTLMVYPIIAGIFAMSNVLGAILLTSASGSGSASMIPNFQVAAATQSDAVGTVQIIAAILVLYLPLVLIPFAFKLAGGAISAISNAATGRAANLAGRAGQKIQKSKEDPNSFFGYRKQKVANTRLQRRADFADRLKQRASSSGRGRLRTGLYGKAAGIVGGVNVEARASATRAVVGKQINDQIATGRDEDIRGLTVNKAAADAAFNAGDHSLRRTHNGNTQYKSLGGQWIDEAYVDAGHARWGNDTFAQQAALSYEMRKAATQEEVEGISNRYMDLATGRGGWGMNQGEAVGSFKGAGFENQNTQLEYKHTSFDAATGAARVDYAGLAKEAYEKKGSYSLAQGGANTIERLREGHAWAVANGDVETQRRIEGVAESFMTRYGGGGGQIGEQDGVPIPQPQGGGQILPGGAAQQSQGVYQTNAPGAASVAESVRQLAVDVGVYRPLDPSTDTHSATGPSDNPRQN
jgi:hypothetical protein